MRTPLPAVVAVNTAALRESRRLPGGANGPAPAAGRTGEPEDDFVEPVVPPDEGVDLTKADRSSASAAASGAPRTSRSRKSWPTRWAPRWERRGRSIVRAGCPRCDNRKIGRACDTEAVPIARSLWCAGARRGDAGAELIVAVNTDPGAAIFHIAHYGVVADLFDVADELTDLISGEPGPAWASARSISAVSSATSKSAPTTLAASEYIARSFGQLTRK